MKTHTVDTRLGKKQVVFRPAKSGPGLTSGFRLDSLSVGEGVIKSVADSITAGITSGVSLVTLKWLDTSDREVFELTQVPWQIVT
jgi:hypothetical protein